MPDGFRGCRMRSNRKTWRRTCLVAMTFGAGFGLTGCQSGNGFLAKNSGPASPPPMWQVKPSDTAGAAKKSPSEIASAEDGSGNAFSPPSGIQRTGAQASGGSGVTQAAGRGQSTGFQSANAGGSRPIVPPPTAQGSASTTASQLPLPKLNGVAPIGASVPATREMDAPGNMASITKETESPAGQPSPLGVADLVPPPAPNSLPVSLPAPASIPAVPSGGDLPVPPPPADVPVHTPVAPPAPVVNPNPPPNVSGPAVSPLPIGGAQLPPPPGSPTMQNSPLSIPAAPSPNPNR